MDLEKGSRRAQRRRHARRMKARARTAHGAGAIAGPTPPSADFRWTDKHGRLRRGLADWSDVRDFRARNETIADHLAVCSCDACGNPRRRLAERTVQERRAEADARDQLREQARGADTENPDR